MAALPGTAIRFCYSIQSTLIFKLLDPRKYTAVWPPFKKTNKTLCSARPSSFFWLSISPILQVTSPPISLISHGKPKVIQMKGAIQNIKRRIKESEEPVENITELDLGGQKITKLTPEIKNILEKCKSLQSLVLSECDLVSLENLPHLANLEELDLSTNSLPDEEIKKIAIYKKLISLNIADNKITKLETVKSLKEAMKNLEVLECADNDIQSLPDYFKTVFKTFPQLRSLDNKDKNGKEIEPAEYQDFEQDEDEEAGNEGEEQAGKWQQEAQGSNDEQQFEQDQEYEQEEQDDEDEDK